MTNNRNNLFWAYEMWGIETGELATAIYDNAKDMDFCDYADTEDIDRASLKAALDQILATAQDGKIELTRKQADYERRCGYLEKSLFGPDLVWVVPSESGTVLIYEHRHFIVK